MKIPIVNPTTYLEEKTFLSSNYTSGTNLSVIDSTGFVDNDIIITGEPCQETTEISILSGNPASTIVMAVNSALSFAHAKDTPIYKIPFNQYELYRSTDGGSNYSLLVTGNLNYDKKYTVYDDASGQSAYKYKFRFKNSELTTYSDYSDVIDGSGWSRGAVGRMVKNVRRNLRDLKYTKFQDWEIIEKLQDGSDEIHNLVLPNAYWTRRETAKTTTANTAKYAFPTNYRAMEMLFYEYNPDSNTDKVYPLEYKSYDEFKKDSSDQNETASDFLNSWTEEPGDTDFPNGYFSVHPTPESTGKNFTLVHHIKDNTFDSYGDVTLCPLPQALENFASRELTENKDDYDKFDKNYTTNVATLRRMQKRNYHPYSLRKYRGQNPTQKTYGRGGVRKTQSDIENYWNA